MPEWLTGCPAKAVSFGRSSSNLDHSFCPSSKDSTVFQLLSYVYYVFEDSRIIYLMRSLPCSYNDSPKSQTLHENDYLFIRQLFKAPVPRLWLYINVSAMMNQRRGIDKIKAYL